MRYVPQRPAFRIVKADADEMSEHYARTLSPAKVEPLQVGGHISVEDRHYSAGPFSIWAGMCHSGMKVTFSRPSDAFVLYLPHSSAMEIDVGRKRLLSTPGTAMVGNMAQFEKLTIHENRGHIGIAFEKSAMVRQLSQLLDAPVLGDIDLCATLETDSAVGSRLAALGSLLWDCFDGEDRVSTTATTHLFQAAMVMILESVPHNYSARLQKPMSPAMPRNLKRAIEYMVANIAEPMSVAEIAREAGTSVRALQTAFQQFKDTTPLNFLRQMRLEGVRKTLSDSANALSIAQVARAWGFTHMGRFSAIYHDAFGQTPSETAKLHSRRGAGVASSRSTDSSR
ncbi:AraC family transcriptional regulator [Sinorhizobium americanum]|uniref:AraC family transcriptional regulator n=1 Tax=Sinorhizobium americanum TaxID=194963 RepID=UPI0007DA1EEB|nr:helix-turn-helix domain-containing protein [Sinorhizobium americanum]OAP37093.1 AraC family transcriptional regulator [Sinorhizobium americanum]